ncbi:MAG: carboxypeptidase-like regulatory domain-containing protein [Gemmatimonadetes bacterium]|nr:carboxypeptidase-like regulatory domain-containing protein [Gemmatimonadota bacterium]
MTADPRLQRPLPELCGEPFRASVAGFLVGVVRTRGSGAPLAGVRVSVPGLSGAGPGAVANEQGVYYLCNVPVGRAVTVLATLPDGTVDTARVEIRAGTASWFDLEVGRRR